MASLEPIEYERNSQGRVGSSRNHFPKSTGSTALNKKRDKIIAVEQWGGKLLLPALRSGSIVRGFESQFLGLSGRPGSLNWHFPQGHGIWMEEFYLRGLSCSAGVNIPDPIDYASNLPLPCFQLHPRETALLHTFKTYSFRTESTKMTKNASAKILCLFHKDLFYWHPY